MKNRLSRLTTECKYAILLVTVSFAVRLMVYALLPQAQPDPNVLNIYPGFLLAHYKDFILHNTILPPITHTLHWLTLLVLNIEMAEKIHVFLIIQFFMNIFSVLFLYKSMVLLDVKPVIAFVMALSYSIGIVSLELWASGGFYFHHDHYTPFFTSLFLWGLVCFYKKTDWLSVFVLSLGASLLILQLSAASYIVPFVLLNLGLLKILKKTFRSELKHFQKYMSIFLLVSASLCGLMIRNWHATGLFSSSSKGGPAIMMFVQVALGWNGQPNGSLENIRTLIRDAGAPEWYLWCFDNIKNPLNPDHPAYEGWSYLSRSFGMCMPKIGDTTPHGEKLWPWDFTVIINKLKTLGENDLVKFVEQDQEDARSRQYLYLGAGLEFYPRWCRIYGEISMRIAKYLFITKPKTYLKGIYHHHKVVFAGLGPDFYTRLTEDLRSGSMIRFIEKDHPKLFKSFHVYLEKYFSRILRAAYFGLPVLILLLLLYSIMRRKPVWKSSDIFMELLLLYFPVFLLALLYSSVVSQENDRYFSHIMPYLIVGLALASKIFVKFKKF